MANTTIYRQIGPTFALSVAATSHTAVPITTYANDVLNFVLCLNTGAVAVAIRITQTGTAATLPIDGTPGDFLLPAAMNQPIVIAIPQKTPQITAIGAGAGPSIVYVTPIGDQS